VTGKKQCVLAVVAKDRTEASLIHVFVSWPTEGLSATWVVWRRIAYICWWRIVNNTEGSGLGLSWSTVPASAQLRWEISQKVSVNVTDFCVQYLNPWAPKYAAHSDIRYVILQEYLLFWHVHAEVAIQASPWRSLQIRCAFYSCGRAERRM
jgi:hypothetical protein